MHIRSEFPTKAGESCASFSWKTYYRYPAPSLELKRTYWGDLLGPAIREYDR